jgi:hypothetical protein
MGRRRTRRGGKVDVFTQLQEPRQLALKKPVVAKKIDTEIQEVFSVFNNLDLVDVLLLETTMRLLMRLNQKPKEQLDLIIKEVYANTDENTVTKNLKYLSDAGIIPMVENPVAGGDGNKRPRIESPAPAPPPSPAPRQSSRVATPSRAVRENIALEAEQRAIAEQRRAMVEAAAEEARVRQQRISQFQTELQGRIALISNTYSELNPILQELARRITDANALSNSVSLLFPESAVNKWKTDMGRKVREIYEHHAIDTQCSNTIGEPNSNYFEPFSANGMCYMCGTNFEDKEGMKASCEHILPIIQAVFFLDLYKAGTTQDMNVLRMEYGWAHLCCNLVKNVTSYLKTTYHGRNPPTWEFSEQSTRTLLNQIKTSDAVYCPETLNAINGSIGPGRTFGTKELWLTNRIHFIREKRLKPILDYIYRGGRQPSVVVVAGLKNLVDTRNLRGEFLGVLDEVIRDSRSVFSTRVAGVKRARPGGKRRKTRRNK